MNFNLVLLLKMKLKHFIFSHQFNIVRSVSILHTTSEIEYDENSKTWTDVYFQILLHICVNTSKLFELFAITFSSTSAHEKTF